ncbi:MAG: GNAT family N-acetyltransferase [Chitinophagaceae bacterium]|nr:GNAT family N-acetyltransferase [Chitinophagaceae bacterium]
METKPTHLTSSPDTSGISLRKITVGDVPELCRIARQSFYDTFTGTCTEEDMRGFLDEYFTPERLRTEVEDEQGNYFFALIGETPVGYMQFKEDYLGLPQMKKWRALELKRIYVLKEYLGRSVARVLMDHFLQFAADENYQVVWLGVWEHNERAKRFYAKYGFEFSGHIHEFPIGSTPQTDQWLWKFLDRPPDVS